MYRYVSPRHVRAAVTIISLRAEYAPRSLRSGEINDISAGASELAKLSSPRNRTWRPPLPLRSSRIRRTCRGNNARDSRDSRGRKSPDESRFVSPVNKLSPPATRARRPAGKLRRRRYCAPSEKVVNFVTNYGRSRRRYRVFSRRFNEQNNSSSDETLVIMNNIAGVFLPRTHDCLLTAIIPPCSRKYLRAFFSTRSGKGADGKSKDKFATTGRRFAAIEVSRGEKRASSFAASVRN